MSWQRRVNRAIGRATGYELKRVTRASTSSRGGEKQPAHKGQRAKARSSRKRTAAGQGRLLNRPVFIFSSIRSGSTLLRVLLNSHSQLHAPHELHLRGLKVQESSKYVEKSMRSAGLSHKDLEHLLWDRVLHWELQHSGKPFLVNKTPGNAFMWKRITTCWPDARFIFLLRHPAAVALSWHEARSSWTLDEAAEDALRYMAAVEEARRELSGLVVRYEELTTEPQLITQRICAFLGVDWEPRMLDYGEQDHGAYKAGLGDWTQKIRTGEIQSPRPLPEPDEIPEVVRDLCVSWGYLEGASTAV